MGKYYSMTGDIPKDIENVAERINRYAMAAIKALFNEMPFGKIVELGPEIKATIKPFYEPKVNNRGELVFGVDVKWDGGLIEFKVMQTGWQGKVVQSDNMQPIPLSDDE